MLPDAKTMQVANVEKYIHDRITMANDSGFHSTKVWIRKANLDEAKKLLTESHYDYEVLADEPNSVQLGVHW